MLEDLAEPRAEEAGADAGAASPPARASSLGIGSLRGQD
jgi:hypothetical protein